MIFRIVLLAVFISSGVYASPIMSDSSVITLKTKNESIVRITRCEEFNALIDKGEKISDYPGTPDRFISDITDALVQCRISSMVKKYNLKELHDAAYNTTIRDVITHFPASEAIAISNSEVESLKTNYKNKTIFQKEKDLKIDEYQRAISKKSYDGYVMINQRVFRSENGKLIKFITLGKFVTTGTWATSDTYKVPSTENRIWQVYKINADDPI